MSKSVHSYVPDVSLSKEDIPVLIGKGGRNMKKCIRNMYDKGCTEPNFKFDVTEDEDESVSISINYSDDDQLALIKSELSKYLMYYEGNKDNFNPVGGGRRRGGGEGRGGGGDGERLGPRPFQNHLMLPISRQNVSAFIGEGGSNIKVLLDKLNTDLHLDNKVKLHVHYEEDLVYVTVTLFHPVATMKDYITVENVINKFVGDFLDTD
jgi:hypothetical protein